MLLRTYKNRKLAILYPFKIKTVDICKALGISRQTLWSWERRGLFTSPRRGNRGDRVFTVEQLDEICKAFGPGGKGQWHYKGLTSG